MVPISLEHNTYLRCTQHTGRMKTHRIATGVLEQYVRHWLGHLVDDPDTVTQACAAAGTGPASARHRTRAGQTHVRRHRRRGPRGVERRVGAGRRGITLVGPHPDGPHPARGLGELDVTYRCALLRQIIKRITATAGIRDPHDLDRPGLVRTGVRPAHPVHRLVIDVAEDQLPRLRKTDYRTLAPSSVPALPM